MTVDLATSSQLTVVYYQRVIPRKKYGDLLGYHRQWCPQGARWPMKGIGMWWCVDGLSLHPVSTVPTFADCKLFKASKVAFLRSRLLSLGPALFQLAWDEMPPLVYWSHVVGGLLVVELPPMTQLCCNRLRVGFFSSSYPRNPKNIL